MHATTKNSRKNATSRKRNEANRSGVPLYLYISNELNAALNARLAQSRRSKTVEVSIALEEYLGRLGDWPVS